MDRKTMKLACIGALATHVRADQPERVGGRQFYPSHDTSIWSTSAKASFLDRNMCAGLLTILPFQSFHDVDLLQFLQSVIDFSRLDVEVSDSCGNI